MNDSVQSQPLTEWNEARIRQLPNILRLYADEMRGTTGLQGLEGVLLFAAKVLNQQTGAMLKLIALKQKCPWCIGGFDTPHTEGCFIGEALGHYRP